jgi:3D (Asp-Asp-Asp) domain-containing protein
VKNGRFIARVTLIADTVNTISQGKCGALSTMTADCPMKSVLMERKDNLSKDTKILISMLTIGMIMIFLVLLVVHHVNAVITESTPYTTTIAEYSQHEAIDMPSEPSRILTMEATAYCHGAVTSRGTVPTVGRTVAVDPNVIPYGSKLTIDGVSGYIAEDCGNYWSDGRSHTGYYKHIRGNRIDIFVADYQTAINFGRREVLVEIE